MKKYFLIAISVVSILSQKFVCAQQNVFSRGEVSTGNFGDGSLLPWFYQTYNNSQGDPDDGGSVRNFVKIGHNNNTTMTTNGRFYLVNSLDFEVSATSPRTINNSGGGLSASGGIYNASSATHTFNTPIGIDGTNVQLHANSTGGLTFNSTIFINNNTVEFGNLGAGEITVSGTMEGTGNVSKVGLNTLTISGSHTYSGTTTINEGVLKLQGNLTNSDVIVKLGATLEIDGNANVKSITVEPGGYIQINSGNTLTLTDNLILESTSTDYSSLISNGTISGTVNYKRYVDAIGSGNDLISAPLTSFLLNFQDFLSFGSPANRDVIAKNSANTLHLFGEYDNTSLVYETWQTYLPTSPPDPAAELLIAAKGYRAATTSGTTITFEGDVLSTDVSISIGTPTADLRSQWNLVGNPYPSYLDARKFLIENSGPMEDMAEAIYAYNSGIAPGGGAATTGSGNFTIINLATIPDPNPAGSFNIAPGQGFFVAAEPTQGFTGTINFIAQGAGDMRTTAGSDDYIAGRNSNLTYNLKLGLTANSEASTSFYFNDNASRGLDQGYDAAAFGNSNIYSHLVEDNTGRAMALQALSLSDLNDVVIPLGVNANQGQQINFNITYSTLPENILVYLEDNIANTTTLLNDTDYIITPNTNLSGTGRFFLRFTNSTLSNQESNLNGLNIYTNQSNKTIVISGQISEGTVAEVFDLQGRLVLQQSLNSTQRSQTIDASSFNSGVYVIQLLNSTQSKTQKIILK